LKIRFWLAEALIHSSSLIVLDPRFTHPMESLSIAPGIEAIAPDAFGDRRCLTGSTVTGSAVRRVSGFRSFYISDVTIPESGTRILSDVSRTCQWLTHVIFQATARLRQIDDFRGSRVKTVNIANSVEVIDSNSFTECRFLCSVPFGTSRIEFPTFPESVDLRIISFSPMFEESKLANNQ
jgi:regulator of extracellular matrix RemA (YlzA/DUF370 family)